jgi:putative ABC transport system permease protein
LDGDNMIIRPKDVIKLFGVLLMCACAVLICTLFLNSNIDLARIRTQIIDPEAIIIYDITRSSANVTSAVTGGALLLTTAVMLLFYIKHFIDVRRSELGILKALGYSNWRIAKGFWIFGLSVFIGTAIGYGLAFAFMPAFYEQMRRGGPLPDTPLHFNPELIVYLIVLPTLVFSLLAILYSYRKLQQPVLELVRGNNTVAVRKLKRKSRQDSEKSFLQDLKQSTVRSRFSLVFFITLSAFIYGNTTQMSFGIAEIGAGGMMAAMMVGVGFVLAVTTLFIAVTTVIKANGKTIAMLRIYGYSDRECSSAILSGYRPAACIGFVLGTAYQHGLMQMMIFLFFNDGVMGVPEYGFNLQAFIISLLSYIVLYEGIMFIYTARIKQIPLKEVMQGE